MRTILRQRVVTTLAAALVLVSVVEGLPDCPLPGVPQTPPLAGEKP